MNDSKGTSVATLVDEATDDTLRDDAVAHLVLKPDWPVALCGANVSELLGTKAPARDRCPSCLKIAATRGLGRPGWNA